MRYDAIIVGGGLAGATLAASLATAGKSVLVLERQSQPQDRVRGEQMHPWGIAEARRLGIYDLLKQRCAREVQLFERHVKGARPIPLRDLKATAPHGAGSLHFRHPEMQRVLLDAAAAAGADVRTGVHVESLRTSDGKRAVAFRSEDGARQQAEGRLIVGADGRDSAVRAKAGFAVRSDPDRLVTAGVLLKNMGGPTDRFLVFQNMRRGRSSSIVPIGEDHTRVYMVYRKGWGDPPRPLSGPRAFGDFAAMCADVGVPEEWLAEAEMAGPLAAFDGADIWVEQPHKDGVVLLGDAAAANDPCYGCGLSMALRGTRMLRDQLLSTDDWDVAAASYAQEQARDAAALRRVTGWLTALMFERGPEADARRSRAFAKLAEDPARMPDFIGLGPEVASDEQARRRLFGEA